MGESEHSVHLRFHFDQKFGKRKFWISFFPHEKMKCIFLLGEDLKWSVGKKDFDLIRRMGEISWFNWIG